METFASIKVKSNVKRYTFSENIRLKSKHLHIQTAIRKYPVKYKSVCSHLPPWWQLKIHWRPTTGRRAVGRRTSWWGAVFVLPCPPQWRVRMLNPSDFAACAYVTDRRDEWPPNSCIEGWRRFINPARHSKTLWVTHTSITSQRPHTKKTKVNFSMTMPPAFHFSASCRFQYNEFTLSYKDHN